MSTSKERMPLSNELVQEDFEPPKDDKINYKLILRNGFRSAVITFLSILVIVLVLNLLSFGMFLTFFYLFIIFAGFLYLLSASFVIWFGPSPQYAAIKAKYRNRSLKIRSTTDALQDGFSKMVAAFFLVFIAII